MEFEERVTIYAKIGQRFIDLKVWAIDGYISQKDFDFWKEHPLTLGYYYDSISKYQTEKSTEDATYENHSQGVTQYHPDLKNEGGDKKIEIDSDFSSDLT